MGIQRFVFASSLLCVRVSEREVRETDTLNPVFTLCPHEDRQRTRAIGWVER